MFGFGLFFVIKNWQGVLLGLGIALVIGATCLLIRVLCMWNRKRQALLELKTMAEKMGAKDIQIDSEKGTISFVTASDAFCTSLPYACSNPLHLSQDPHEISTL